MTAEEVTAAVRPIVDRIKQESFVEGYQASDEEAVGILLSKFFEWDGIAVLQSASFGLEDANFHTLAGKVDKLITSEQRAADRAVAAQNKRSKK